MRSDCVILPLERNGSDFCARLEHVTIASARADCKIAYPLCQSSNLCFISLESVNACSSQELQPDLLASSNDALTDLKARTHSSRSLKPVGGLVIARSDLNFSRCIGEGSFGRVYLGIWRETTVAIKILFGAGVPKSLPMPLSADEVARASVLGTRVRLPSQSSPCMRACGSCDKRTTRTHLCILGFHGFHPGFSAKPMGRGI